MRSDEDSVLTHAGRSRPGLRVPFFRADLGPEAITAIEQALLGGHHAGNGGHTAECHALLRGMTPASYPLITHSGTAALEMAALLLELAPGDEVLMPSWTFSSTANAVALRGATPVFVDVCEDTLNIDPERVEAAITNRTRAVFCVHYGGVACDMDALQDLCREHGLALVEDAAQAVLATWRGAPLGGIGDFGALSFHASKNVSSGEGGALLVNRPDLVSRAEQVWEKGTDRACYARGEVEFYRWRSIGSSYLPSEIIAALLSSQLRRAPDTTERRLQAWRRYDALFRSAGLQQRLTLPTIPRHADHNGHIYALRTRTAAERDQLMRGLRARGVEAATHYVPLHSAPAGLKHGRTHGSMSVTDRAAETLLRLPLDALITPGEQAWVVDAVVAALR